MTAPQLNPHPGTSPTQRCTTCAVYSGVPCLGLPEGVYHPGREFKPNCPLCGAIMMRLDGPPVDQRPLSDAATKRIARAVARYMTEHQICTIDGEEYNIADIGISHYECLECAHGAGLARELARENLKTWLELEALRLRGTESQRERWVAGVLPEDELLFCAREELFAGFKAHPELKRWAGRYHDDLVRKISHQHDCPRDQDPVLETGGASDLDAGPWHTLKTIAAVADEIRLHPMLVQRDIYPDTVQVEAVSRWAVCPCCKAEAKRYSAKVSVQWAGHTLVREYSL